MEEKNPKREYKEILDEYKSAITLLDHQANLMWQENGAFLIAVTVLIGFIGTGLTNHNAAMDRQKYILIVGSVLGLILSFLWYVTFHHNYPYHLLRIYQARDLEKDLDFSLFRDGNLIYNGKKLNFDNDEVQMKFISRCLPPSKSFNLLIWLFIAAFGFLIIYTILCL